MRAPFQYANVKAIEDFNTKEVTVKGFFGIAPNETTPYEYPVSIHEKGYWNKGKIKQVVSDVKKRLLAEVHEKGYELKPSEIKVDLFWSRFV